MNSILVPSCYKTAAGAALHALQVLSGEVEPYIEFIENNILNSENN